MASTPATVAVTAAATAALGALVVNYVPGQILTSSQLNQIQQAKVDTVNGKAQGLTLTGAAVDATTSVAGVPASQLVHADSAGNVAVAGTLTTPAGQFGAPQAGSSLGVGAYTYLAVNPVVPGSLTVSLSTAPAVRLRSVLADDAATISQIASGNLVLAAGTGAAIQAGSPIQITTTTLDVTKCGSITGASGCAVIQDATGTTRYVPYF